MSTDAGMPGVEAVTVKHSAVCSTVCNEGKVWCERWSRGMHRTCEIYVTWMADDVSETVRSSDDVSRF
jgi:hypothetical protein